MPGMNPQDHCNLERFLEAQDPVFEEVCSELRAGSKRSHWMWFIFPQMKGLGHSSMATYYAISGLQEAKDYLQHQVLDHDLFDPLFQFSRVVHFKKFPRPPSALLR